MIKPNTDLWEIWILSLMVTHIKISEVLFWEVKRRKCCCAVCSRERETFPGLLSEIRSQQWHVLFLDLLFTEEGGRGLNSNHLNAVGKVGRLWHSVRLYSRAESWGGIITICVAANTGCLDCQDCLSHLLIIWSINFRKQQKLELNGED